MGRNVDLKELLGLGKVPCPICKEDLVYLDEVDMDCDISNPQQEMLVIHTECDNCNNEVRVEFDVEVKTKRE